jgi:hypothetical protein
MNRTLVSLAVLCTLAGPGVALAGDYVPMPKTDGKQTPLRIRFVEYTGGVNGEMIVDVRNPSRRTETFTAEGLYFVPDGDPEKAPQRLGATGPFQIVEPAHGAAITPSGEVAPPKAATVVARTAESLALAPGREVRVRLQVFCIDSHRPSPQASHTFHLGGERLPKTLREEIATKTRASLAKARVAYPKAAPAALMPAAKAEIQQNVWGAPGVATASTAAAG